MDILDGETKVRDYALERQMMLSDGVFAIAMTLLALELKPPAGWDHTVSGLLGGGWQQFFAYGMSFFTIAISWATHRQSFGRFRKSDFMLTVLGLLTLGVITLIPFATRLYSEDMIAPTGATGAVRFYLGLFAAASLFGALTWGYACVKPGILDPTVGWRARVVVFLLTLVSTPLMTALGVLVGMTKQLWMLALFGALGFGIGMIRRWASRADAADLARRGAKT